jgi:hypothetical protein
MKKPGFLTNLSYWIMALSFIYLVIQIHRVVYLAGIWIRDYETYYALFGVFNEICEILYIPLWGITVAFSLLFFNYWLKDKVNF